MSTLSNKCGPQQLICFMFNKVLGRLLVCWTQHRAVLCCLFSVVFKQSVALLTLIARFEVQTPVTLCALFLLCLMLFALTLYSTLLPLGSGRTSPFTFTSVIDHLTLLQVNNYFLFLKNFNCKEPEDYCELFYRNPPEGQY